MITQTLPAAPEKISAGKNEILMITNADLRESANLACWPMQEKFEAKLQDMLGKLGYQMKRAHAVDHQRGHGFISSQRQGSDLFAQIDENAPLIVLLTAWQYSHHVAPSLVHHKANPAAGEFRRHLAGAGGDALSGWVVNQPG